MSQSKDSTLRTLMVALAVCLVCSVIVSTAAVMLKPQQIINKKLEKQRNILGVVDLLPEDRGQESVNQAFKQVTPKVVDLETGEYVTDVDPLTYDMRKAAKDPEQNVQIENDIASIRTRPKYAVVYLVEEQGKPSKIILPVNGYALWSTLYGFLALEGDAQTVYGISFYEHAETPGLGGEIDNPKWKSLWKGKKVYGDNGNVRLEVVKGNVNADTPNAEHKVDGLAGATLTSNGVTNLIKYWMSEQGYGPYLAKIKGDA